MMSSKMQWLLMVFGLVVLARSGSALRCWDCASNVNFMCKDLSNVTEHQEAFHTRRCDPGPYQTAKPICRKIVKRENGEMVVIRQCSIPNVDETDITDGSCGPMAMPSHSVIESCHICSTDLCNSATSASSVHLLQLGALAFLGYRFVRSK